MIAHIQNSREMFSPLILDHLLFIGGKGMGSVYKVQNTRYLLECNLLRLKCRTADPQQVEIYGLVEFTRTLILCRLQFIRAGYVYTQNSVTHTHMLGLPIDLCINTGGVNTEVHGLPYNVLTCTLHNAEITPRHLPITGALPICHACRLWTVTISQTLARVRVGIRLVRSAR